MADLYFHVWVTVTSLTIIVLVAAYIIYDRFAIRYEALTDENEKEAKMQSLKSKVMTILGGLAVIGGSYWLYYIQTHEIYITKSLRGAHDIAPPIIMALIGLILLILGIKKHVTINKHSS